MAGFGHRRPESMGQNRASMNLRVIHVVTPDFGHNFSGHYLYVSSLLRRWKVEGISLSSLGSGREGSNTKWLDSGEHGAFSERFGMSSRTSGRFSRMMWSLRLLVNLVRTQNEYDILHFHALNWGSLLSPGVAHIWGKKAIYTITRQGYDNPSAIASGRSGRLKVMLFKNYDGIIGLAPALLEDCRSHHCTSHLGLLPSFMIVEELENGRDELKRSTARARFGLSPEECAILFVGSIIPRKGVDIVVDLFIRLAQEDRNLRLFLVGPASRQESSKLDESYVARQRQKLARAGVEPLVHWAGLVRDSARLADYYHMADIFVLPTKSEGSPQVFAEAMAASLPVVTTRLPGITDASVVHGENGYLVDARSCRWICPKGCDSGERQRLANADGSPCERTNVRTVSFHWLLQEVSSVLPPGSWRGHYHGTRSWCAERKDVG